MPDITLEYLIANDSELLPHIEERALEVSHHQTVMLQNMLPLPPMSGWAERATSAYLNTDVAVELEEAEAIPVSSLYRHRLSSVKPREWGLAQEVTDRRISSDPENVIATVINSLGIGLRRRIEQNAFAAANSFIYKLGSGDALSLATLLALTSQANHVATAPGNLLYVVHPYQVFHMLSDLITIGSSSNVTQENRAGFLNLREMPDITNAAIAIPNIGLLTISHNMPRRLSLRLKVHGTAGTFRLQVGEGHSIVPTSDRSTTTPYNITAEIAGGAAATVIKTALDNLNQGIWTVGGTNTGVGFLVTYPTDLYIHDLYQIRVPVDLSTADNVTLDSPAPLTYIQKSSYDKVSGTSPYTVVPNDIAGVALGIEFDEVTATAKALAYKPRALAFDPRTPPKLTSETQLDERLLRYAYYQTFGIVAWDPRMGFTYEAEAQNPL